MAESTLAEGMTTWEEAERAMSAGSSVLDILGFQRFVVHDDEGSELLLLLIVSKPTNLASARHLKTTSSATHPLSPWM